MMAGLRDKRLPSAILLSLVVAALGWQIVQAADYTADRWQRKVWHNRHWDAFERGADGLAGGRFYRFIAFMRREIPQDSTVVFPPDAGPLYLTSRGLLQFFLFPRGIVTCTSPEAEPCRVALQDPSSYIVGFGHFPSAEFVAGGREAIPFSDEVNLYLPTR